MTEAALVKSALDGAFTAHVGQLFQVMMVQIANNDDEAQTRFIAAVRRAQHVHDQVLGYLVSEAK